MGWARQTPLCDGIYHETGDGCADCREFAKQCCPQCKCVGFHKMDCSDTTKWSYSDNGGFEKV